MNRSPIDAYKAHRAAERLHLRIGIALIILALVLAIWMMIADTADAAPLSDGNCRGYTWATGVVIGTPRGRVTVYVDGATGTKWTLARYAVGERVLVRGFACYGVLDGRFAVRKVR